MYAKPKSPQNRAVYKTNYWQLPASIWKIENGTTSSIISAGNEQMWLH